MPVDSSPKDVKAGRASPASGRSPQEDARLLRETAGGDEAAYRTLVNDHLRTLLSIGRRMLGETHEAEDMAQEALLRLWRSAGQIEIGPAGLRPWLCRVAANLCLDRLRSRKIAPRTQADLPEPVYSARQLRSIEETELGQRVDRALQALPERQRLALVLFHYQGMNQSEAALALDVSEDALESLLARARRSLKAALADEWKELLPDGTEHEGHAGWKAGYGHAE